MQENGYLLGLDILPKGRKVGRIQECASPTRANANALRAQFIQTAFALPNAALVEGIDRRQKVKPGRVAGHQSSGSIIQAFRYHQRGQMQHLAEGFEGH